MNEKSMLIARLEGHVRFEVYENIFYDENELCQTQNRTLGFYQGLLEAVQEDINFAQEVFDSVKSNLIDMHEVIEEAPNEFLEETMIKAISEYVPVYYDQETLKKFDCLIYDIKRQIRSMEFQKR